MATLAERILKTARKTIPEAELLSKTDLLDKQVVANIGIPILNIAWSGRPDGGLIPGVKMVVGDSRTFKTFFCLLEVKAYLNKYDDAVCVFGDSEFGANQKYWDQAGIDMSRVIHVPLTNVEKMQISMMQILDETKRGEHVIFFIDSISQLPSSKELKDAIDGKDTTDMTRARALNSYWRTVMTQINLKNLIMVWINSYYDELGNQYAEKNIKGGKQGFLSSDAIWFITRSQEKIGDQFAGWSFNINIMKSRFVKEKSKFSLVVLYDGGVDEFSGLLEIARALGYVDMVSNGWYQRTTKGGFSPDEKKYQKSGMDADFWYPLLENPKFCDEVYATFSSADGVSILKPETLARLEEFTDGAKK